MMKGWLYLWQEVLIHEIENDVHDYGYVISYVHVYEIAYADDDEFSDEVLASCCFSYSL